MPNQVKRLERTKVMTLVMDEFHKRPKLINYLIKDPKKDDYLRC